MNVDIPEDPDDSFYAGEVTVMLKDSIFQASSSFRAVVEMEKVVRKTKDWEKKNILIVYTDGGPERMITYESVRVPLCTLFKRNPNIDIHIALRTAPGQSYVNYVERIMSILNIALQNCSLTREQLSLVVEEVIQKCKGWEDFRKHPEIRPDWESSLRKMILKVVDRFKKLKLKDEPFKVLIYRRLLNN